MRIDEFLNNQTKNINSNPEEMAMVGGAECSFELLGQSFENIGQCLAYCDANNIQYRQTYQCPKWVKKVYKFRHAVILYFDNEHTQNRIKELTTCD